MINIFSHTSNSRRGISSVVGALIFTVLMIAGFSAMSLALDSQTDIVNTQRVVADIELKKQQEQFGIAVFADANNILNVSVDNNGQNPVEISRVWITNKTLPTQPATPFSVASNDAFVPTGFTSNVLSTQPLYIVPDTYDVKVISTLGTVRTAELTIGAGPSSSGLRAELITNPPDVNIGQNVTVAMVVTNTGSTIIEGVSPGPLTVTPALAVVASSSPIPVSVDLTPGESVLFSWDYTISGSNGDPVNFSSYASGTELNGPTIISNTISDVSVLRLPTESTGGDQNYNIINEDLLARPKLFLIIPSPQGDSNDKALWGINVANPVNAPMEVSKLSITAFAPGANNNDKIFAASCGAVNIFPTGTNSWNCPSENVIMWQNYANPVVIAPNSTQQFLVRVLPGTIAGQNILETVVVQASVFTTVGSFGKSGYQTTMYDGTEVIGNVYLSSIVDSRNNADIQSTRTGIIPGSTQTFNVVFADLDTSTSTWIKSGAQLIINVPKDWTDVQIVNNYGFVNPPTITTFGDGSTQIIGTTSTNLGDASNQADTIQFSAKAPNVTNDQMYVMYVLAQGQTTNNFSIGPLNEIVLQVNGS
ncbi:hypothetical protein [Nitrosarchaeum sp. AC2]|uniref:hypothetical protein n=1 Tax=Nitrosarchaeum sp. AC2 TaxID=2259673 RepID=UPI0015CB00BE|nr:hypothetical protein [Nitrosarchaeum sp. AC2]QLH10716.1 hypothetical protein DSQ20_03930 [Nitrosarchaeum sp. AC2]